MRWTASKVSGSVWRVWGAALAGPLPGGDVAEALVVAEGLAVLGLALLAEVAAAGLLAGEGVADHELAELEEVGDPAGALEALVHRAVAEDPDVLPELVAQRGDLGQRLLEAGLVAGHAAVVPHDLAELAVVVVDRPGAADRQEPLHLVVDGLLRLGERRVVDRRPGASPSRPAR